MGMNKKELKDILDEHARWLRGEAGAKKANLRSADLRSADLSFADLRFADLRSADLSFANLRSADLSSANLRSANLRSANLSSADLSFANLSSADLRSADLRSADLRSANLIIFRFQRDQAYYTADRMLRIGCEVHDVAEWVKKYKVIGEKHGYTKEQIAAYGAFIKICAKVCRETNR